MIVFAAELAAGHAKMATDVLRKAGAVKIADLSSNIIAVFNAAYTKLSDKYEP